MAYQCPVCGFPELNDPPRSRGSGGGSYEICPSCGFEFGVTDEDLGYEYDQWRAEWVSRGMPWSSRGRPEPKSWNPAVQLESLPK